MVSIDEIQMVDVDNPEGRRRHSLDLPQLARQEAHPVAAVRRPAQQVDFAHVVGQEAVGSEGHPRTQEPVAQLQQGRARPTVLQRGEGGVHREQSPGDWIILQYEATYRALCQP